VWGGLNLRERWAVFSAYPVLVQAALPDDAGVLYREMEVRRLKPNARYQALHDGRVRARRLRDEYDEDDEYLASPQLEAVAVA